MAEQNCECGYYSKPVEDGKVLARGECFCWAGTIRCFAISYFHTNPSIRSSGSVSPYNDHFYSPWVDSQMSLKRSWMVSLIGHVRGVFGSRSIAKKRTKLRRVMRRLRRLIQKE